MTFNLHERFTAEELERVNQGFNDAVLGSGDFDLANHLDGRTADDESGWQDEVRDPRPPGVR